MGGGVGSDGWRDGETAVMGGGVNGRQAGREGGRERGGREGRGRDWRAGSE